MGTRPAQLHVAAAAPARKPSSRQGRAGVKHGRNKTMVQELGRGSQAGRQRGKAGPGLWQPLRRPPVCCHQQAAVLLLLPPYFFLPFPLPLAPPAGALRLVPPTVGAASSRSQGGSHTGAEAALASPSFTRNSEWPKPMATCTRTAAAQDELGAAWGRSCAFDAPPPSLTVVATESCSAGGEEQCSKQQRQRATSPPNLQHLCPLPAPCMCPAADSSPARGHHEDPPSPGHTQPTPCRRQWVRPSDGPLLPPAASQRPPAPCTCQGWRSSSCRWGRSPARCRVRTNERAQQVSVGRHWGVGRGVALASVLLQAGYCTLACCRVAG